MTKQEIERELSEVTGRWLVPVHYPRNIIGRVPLPLTGDYAMELLKELLTLPGCIRINGWPYSVTIQIDEEDYHAPSLEEAIALAYIAWRKQQVV